MSRTLSIGRCFAACVVASLLATSIARAQSQPTSEQVLLSESLLVEGNNSVISNLSVPGAGELFLTLTDLNFPTPMNTLSLYVSNANGALDNSLTPGTLTLDLTHPGTVFADVVWNTTTNQNSGLFNLTATFVAATPVPLTAGTACFLAGLVLLYMAGVRRRNDAGPLSTQLQ